MLCCCCISSVPPLLLGLTFQMMLVFVDVVTLAYFADVVDAVMLLMLMLLDAIWCYLMLFDVIWWCFDSVDASAVTWCYLMLSDVAWRCWCFYCCSCCWCWWCAWWSRLIPLHYMEQSLPTLGIIISKILYVFLFFTLFLI